VKQVAQRLKDGAVEVLDVPAPSLRPQGVLVDVRSSLLSAGTERSKVETGRKSLIGKARARPDQVRLVVEKAGRDGVRDALAAVRARLGRPEPLGYSAAGVVLAVGDRVRDLAVGDRVACAGAGYASHADVDYVPGNLCVRLPDGVGFDQGCFATLGAIAMHGVRRAEPGLGERVAVIGLGLVGQLASQLLKAAGCRVVGIDLGEEPIAVAREMGGIDEGIPRSQLDEARLAREGACDAVLIAAATESDDPVELAAALCRDRGRVVVVGDVGMQVPRAPYYEKELDLRLSRSYGPGRYDREYEERGLDYPIGYVRWTECRNMGAFLDLVARGEVDVSGLVRERVSVEEAPGAYDRLLAGDASSLGILIEYGESAGAAPEARPGSGPGERPRATPFAGDPAALGRVGAIGAGSFASRVAIPGLRKAGFELAAVASASGLSARSAAQRFGFGRADTAEGIIDDPDIGLVAVLTRHSSHADLAERAMRSGKAVFVEKPPCLTEGELERLRDARAESGAPLFVGFNRRHAPLAVRLRDHVRRGDAPLELLYRVSAGPATADHWLDDPEEGGGRLIGEGCHFVDFACWLVGEWPERVACAANATAGTAAPAKSFAVTLAFPGGSLATILYGTAGAPGVRKEYAEAHSGGRSAILDDFRSLTLVEGRRRRKVRSRRQDKGHGVQMRRMRAALAGEEPLPGDDLLSSMSVVFAAARAAEEARVVRPQRAGSPDGAAAERRGSSSAA
jgi:predicted dehydrogenase